MVPVKPVLFHTKFAFPGRSRPLMGFFPIPDALQEKKREKHPYLRSFLRAVVVLEMQIKLRQGFGRAIRTETDTCVVASWMSGLSKAAAISQT